MANIFITCTDTIKSRTGIWNLLKNVRGANFADTEKPFYWMDFGNTHSSGQVVMGTIPEFIAQPKSEHFTTVSSLKVATELFNYKIMRDDDSGPSCSLAEALEKQDLFINSTLAQLGCNIMWKMFRNGMIEHNGLFLNLETLRVNPISVSKC